jgi:Undecaprenyl-phosphate glucose phosphotransferase
MAKSFGRVTVSALLASSRFALTVFPLCGFTTPLSNRCNIILEREGAMVPSNRQLLILLFLFCDLALVAGLILLGLPESARAHLWACVSLAALCFAFFRLYSLHRLRRASEELTALIKAMGLWLLLLLILDLGEIGSRWFLASFVTATTLILFGFRRLWWLIIGSLRAQGYNPTPVVIVGTGRVARRTARAIHHAGWTGMHVFGFIEDEPTQWVSDLPIVGQIADLPRLILEQGISQVFIALPFQRYADVRRIYETLAESIVEIRLILDAPRLAPLSLGTTKIDGLTVVGLRENPHLGLNVAVKRGMDLILAGLALLVLAPVFFALIVIVKCTSRGPIFYTQERCGLNGRRFKMIKFRTMVVDAEKQTGPIWASAQDSRTTAVGTWLRRLSLDELPQLFNVLRGEMSLVGPRPERPVFIERFRKSLPNYMSRHMVKAGMTGWAQVQGWRGNTSLRQRLRHDLYYITHWNPWFDLRILFLTLVRGFFHKNAY